MVTRRNPGALISRQTLKVQVEKIFPALGKRPAVTVRREPLSHANHVALPSTRGNPDHSTAGGTQAPATVDRQAEMTEQMVDRALSLVSRR